MAKLYDRVKVATATTGTGTITLGAAVRSSTSGDFLTFAEIGVTNGDVVAYFIQDGANWASGVGTYTSSGTTLSRDASEKSWNGSSYSTAALSLSGSAVVYIGARAADLVLGPASVADNAIVRFDGTTGKLVQSSATVLDDAGNIGLGGTPLTTGGGWIGLTFGGTDGSGTSGELYCRASDGTITAQIVGSASNPLMGVRKSGDSALDLYFSAFSGGNVVASKSRNLTFNTGASLPVRMTVSTTGNVTIAAPDSGIPLSVAGVVESTASGFKFPDGTTQATAFTTGEAVALQCFAVTL